MGRSQRRLRLRQPEAHVHLAVHRPSETATQGTSDGVSLNFGKRGILDPVEKVARDLLGLESRTSLDRSRKLAEAAAQQAVEGARDHLRGTREPTRLHLGRTVLQVQNCALGLSRIPPFYKFGNSGAQAVNERRQGGRRRSSFGLWESVGSVLARWRGRCSIRVPSVPPTPCRLPTVIRRSQVTVRPAMCVPRTSRMSGILR
jgi:hypothetical protein